MRDINGDVGTNTSSSMKFSIVTLKAHMVTGKERNISLSRKLRHHTYLRIEIGRSLERFVKFLFNSGNVKERGRNAFFFKFFKDAMMS